MQLRSRARVGRPCPRSAERAGDVAAGDGPGDAVIFHREEAAAVLIVGDCCPGRHLSLPFADPT